MLDAMTLDQLRVLAAVVEAGSFSAASRNLRRAQSAISQAMQALESTLRVELFDRSGKIPRLTPAGEVILSDAKRLIAGATALRARAESIVDGVEPELSLAVDPLFPTGVLMKALRQLGKVFPELAVTVLTGGLAASEHHLRSGSARLAIYSIDMTGATDLDAEFLTTIEMVPVIAAGHPLGQRQRPLSRAELADHVQLVLTDASGHGCWTRGIVSLKVWRFADLSTRLDYLREGFGWCNMPMHLVADLIAQGKLRRLSVREQSGFTVPLQAVHLQDRRPGRAGRKLVELLRAELADSPSRTEKARRVRR